jgi:hypothetical protein
MTEVSMHLGWHSFRALRSDSNEWPTRIGVGAEGGSRIVRMWDWTSARVVVTESRAPGVIPDHLKSGFQIM